MAISEIVPGITVTVQCDTQPLPEFEDPDAHDHDHDDAASPPKEIKYIECIDDACFTISVAIDRAYAWGYRNHVLVPRIWVDGEFIQGSILKQHEPIWHTFLCRGKEVDSGSGMWSLRKFKFAAVTTVEDVTKERVERDLKKAKDLGTIEIRFFRAIMGDPSTCHVADTNRRELELAEKSLKGKSISHSTSYGGYETIPTPKFTKVEYLPEDNGPIIVFKFLYRSRDALKRDLIVPRSPSRSPTIEYLTPAVRDRLARERLNELRERKLKPENGVRLIKHEFNEVFDLTTDSPSPYPTKKSRLEDGREIDVVDLTDD